MTNETDSDSPSSDATRQPPRQPPVPPSTPPQGEVRPNSNNSPNDQQDTARELAREFRWVEGVQLAVNAILAIVGVVALLIYHGQLKVMSDTLTEIRNSKADTTRIITASETQAIAANKIAGAADSFSKTASNAVDEFKKAATESASISKLAAKNAEDAIHVSERAYVTVASPQFDLSKGVVTASILNTGKIPSGIADTTIHYIVVNTPISTESKFDMKAQSVETHWRRFHNASIPVGNPFLINEAFKVIDANLVSAGHQHIILVGFVRYNDGFPTSPAQQTAFCFEELYGVFLKQNIAIPCDPLSYLPAAEGSDGYPENEER